MIVEKIAAKKTLAVTLALVLGLSLPGGAWSRMIAPRAGAGAGSAASFAGTQTVQLSIAPLSNAGAEAISGDVPVRAAQTPAALPASVDAHPVIGLINQLQEAGVVLPETFHSLSDAAMIDEAARALPEGSSTRNQLASLAASIRAARAGEGGGSSGGVEEAAKTFDGAKFGSPAGETVVAEPLGLFGRAAAAMRRAFGLKPAAKPRASAPSPAPAPAPKAADPKLYELSADQVRYAPAVETLPESTKKIENVEKTVVGQDEALKAIRFALEMKPAHYNLYVAGSNGSGRAMAVRQLLSEISPRMQTPSDLVAVTNFEDKDEPHVLALAPGKAAAFAAGVEEFVSEMKEKLQLELSSGETGRQKQKITAVVQTAQAQRQAEFDKKIGSIRLAGKFGVYFKASQSKEGVKVSLAISHDGQPMTKEDVEAKVASGAFTKAEWDQAQAELEQKKGGVVEAYQTMLEASISEAQKMSAIISRIEQQAAAGLVEHLAGQLKEIVAPGLKTAADEAAAKRAQERDEEINSELQKFSRQKFGKFGVAVQAGMDKDGAPVVLAVPAFGRQPVDDEAAAGLIAAGQFTREEYAQAKSEIAARAKSLQAKFAEFVAQTRKELEEVDAARPALAPEVRHALAYVQALGQFAAGNYKIFLGIKEDGEGIKPAPGSRPIAPEDFFRVSVLTDNGSRKGAPVVWEDNPTYERLFGVADGNQRNMVIPGVGLVKTEGVGGPTFKTGSFLKADGGFLVLHAMDALKNPGVWQALMNAVRTGQAEIAENGLLGVASMKGRIYHIPAKVKVVLLGSPMIHSLLEQHDSDFASNFQSVAHFLPTIRIGEETVAGLLRFLKNSVVGSAGEIMNLTRDAIGRLLEVAARLADSNQYFTTQFGALHGLLQEASYWAQKAGRSEVTGADIETALSAKRDREEVHAKRMMEYFEKNVFRVDTKGAAVGQINGLAVMGSFGVPARVTFTVTPGQPGIVSTDKDAGATGKSFNKALGNEWSFIVNEFGQKKPVRAQVRVSFEQNYGGIDGDSATSTTIYGILSVLSGVPIKQNFAVTGSADQFGNVQAIGGVNEKIEGFFALCKNRGLTGDQGVIIPKANVAGLQLSPEVSQAIEDGKFHVYAVDHVSQGIEILTGEAYERIKEKAQARIDEMGKPDPTQVPGPGAPWH